MAPMPRQWLQRLPRPHTFLVGPFLKGGGQDHVTAVAPGYEAQRAFGWVSLMTLTAPFLSPPRHAGDVEVRAVVLGGGGAPYERRGSSLQTGSASRRLFLHYPRRGQIQTPLGMTFF